LKCGGMMKRLLSWQKFSLVFILFILVFSSVAYAIPASPLVANPLISFSTSRFLPPEMLQVYQFVLDPSSTAKSLILPQIGSLNANLAKSIQLVSSPSEELKSRIFLELYSSLPEDAQSLIDNSYEYGNYAQDVLKYSDETGWGSFECKERGGEYSSCSIENPDGEPFIEMSASLKMDYDEESEILSFENSEDRDANIKIGSFEVAGIKKGQTVKYHRGDLSDTISLDSGTVRFGKELYYRDISNADFKISRGSEGNPSQIEFASFISDTPSKHFFVYDYGGGARKYSFETLKSQSYVIFDPEEKIIFVDNFRMKSNAREINSDHAEIFLTENGDYDSMSLFGKNANYKDLDVEIFNMGGEELGIYFDQLLPEGTDFPAVSLSYPSDNLRISTQGFVSYTVRDEIEIIDEGFGGGGSTMILADDGNNYLSCKNSCSVFKNGNAFHLTESEDGLKKNVVMDVESYLSSEGVKGDQELFIKLKEEEEGAIYGHFGKEGIYSETYGDQLMVVDRDIVEWEEYSNHGEDLISSKQKFTGGSEDFIDLEFFGGFKDEKSKKIFEVRSALKKYFPENAIAGIMGNIYVETGGSYDYTQKQFRGPGYGLFQFDFQKKYYQEWIIKNNLVDSADMQARFVFENIYSDSPPMDVGTGTCIKLREVFERGSVEEVAYEFAKLYERPAEGREHFDRRISSAESHHVEKSPLIGLAGSYLMM
jgi:hypothetical protein